MKKFVIALLNITFILSSFGFAGELNGIWENGERFIEYRIHSDNTVDSDVEPDTMRTVLKPYYRFYYDDSGRLPFSVKRKDEQKNIYILSIKYAGVKKRMEAPVWIYKDSLFASFYQKEPFKITKNGFEVDFIEKNDKEPSILNGFWIEKGCRKELRLYPQDTPDSFDAFFFMNGQYIQFRYWKDYLMYREQSAVFKYTKEELIKFPKFLRRGGDIYTCITSNGSTLRNYTKGTYTINTEDAKLYLTLTPDGGGPGSDAVGDTYPHEKYAEVQDLPLFIDEKDGAFGLDAPFVHRSAVTDLDAVIKKHNSLRRPPPEPMLQADQLDFYWERIQMIRSKR